MVAIFVDENGKFIPDDAYSVVSALSIPHRSLNKCRREIGRVTADWPRHKGELKGGGLSTDHLTIFVNILKRHHALLPCCAIDVSDGHEAAIEAHRIQQCAILACDPPPGTDAHSLANIQRLRQSLDAMPTQLYAQCTAQTLLLRAAILDVPNYYAQRRPADLAHFEWIVDAKSAGRLTPQEAWWKETLGPMLGALSEKAPMVRLDDRLFNYSYFDQNKGARSSIENLDMDVATLVTDNLKFLDSESDVLLQVVDVIGNKMRRALNNPLSDLAAVQNSGACRSGAFGASRP